MRSPHDQETPHSHPPHNINQNALLVLRRHTHQGSQINHIKATQIGLGIASFLASKLHPLESWPEFRAQSLGLRNRFLAVIDVGDYKMLGSGPEGVW